MSTEQDTSRLINTAEVLRDFPATRAENHPHDTTLHRLGLYMACSHSLFLFDFFNLCAVHAFLVTMLMLKKLQTFLLIKLL